VARPQRTANRRLQAHPRRRLVPESPACRVHLFPALQASPGARRPGDCPHLESRALRSQ